MNRSALAALSFLPVVVLLLAVMDSPVRAEWKPAEGPLRTRWAKDVAPGNAHPEYPRPQMARKDWLNLNGLWDYAIRSAESGRPDSFDGEILVPFPVESALSGVLKRVGQANRLWYRRTVTIPESWSGGRILLHFGAVDWESTVWVNGREVGSHRGGYTPFSIDVTEALQGSGPQEFVLAVSDPSDKGHQPRGKQVESPHGIWYTPTTGIWQTVWLEPVPKTSIEHLKIVPDLAGERLLLTVAPRGEARGVEVKAVARDGGKEVAEARGAAGAEIALRIERPKTWSPSSPFLYDLHVELAEGGKTIDSVTSYFGMRSVALGKDERGILRLLLNNEPLFQFGPLDQGFWPDGLYTAPTDEALRYDIEVTRRLGFNMARKHVKVEPDRWYYWCDRLGLLVWQDMPNGGPHFRSGDLGRRASDEAAAQFERELRALIDAFHNHPSIVMWVVFNEGWGQYDTPRITRWVKEHDPTRLVNNASGWTDTGAGDVIDIHNYPSPASPQPEAARAAVLGEYGGLGLPVEGHTWQDKANWGYRSFTTREALSEAYSNLIATLRPLLHSPGLAAAVYTQTTDVEIEVNGLLTYDRALIKMGLEETAAMNRRVYLPPPILRPLVPTSESEGVAWRYTTEKPGDGWEQPGFDASSWQEAPGGFGRKDTPGAVARTDWHGSDIWIRRSFALERADLSDIHLRVHHDEDAEVYVNGQLVSRLTGYTTSYVSVPLGRKGREALRSGQNTLAIHCKQTGGGQYIDAGIVEVEERAR